MHVILGRIDILLSWEHMESRCMEDCFYICVALATVIGTDRVCLFNIYTVANSATLPTCQNLK
jgi:hypothetical protein